MFTNISYFPWVCSEQNNKSINAGKFQRRLCDIQTLVSRLKKFQTVIDSNYGNDFLIKLKINRWQNMQNYSTELNLFLVAVMMGR